MEQLIPWAIFCTAVLVFCLIKPPAARVFVGAFFILMAIGVNIVLSFAAPDQFVKLGTDNALIPFYAWVFQTFVAPAPQIVGILAAAGETAIELLILSGGRRARLGLVGAIIFLIVITPLGVWTLPNPIFAAGLVRLLREEYPRNLLRLRRTQHLPVTPSGHA
ncbi:hypothetical protein LFT44_04765 [Arthrobacter sp. FW306-05-C]|uniref:hypothetical protein n=1 Tax=Arthrobacter sp. FW306-05-C TaxID=2879620 RepID=UPI001F3ABF0F|nr:hypothetical protein [Arthrobacter sp. FW306-05-C]UKA67731.1 hypothetical protein LFT44_04765 [Arthrobacter sp. FW306-05-C]